MKTLALLFTLMISAVSFADTTIEASKGELEILDLIVDVHRTYSQTSELDAKVFELLGGDGMNPTRMILVLNTGYHDSKVFELGEMMWKVTRVVFLAKDVIVINYIQDTFETLEDMEPFQVKKSVTIQVLRNADGTLANEIKILK